MQTCVFEISISVPQCRCNIRHQSGVIFANINICSNISIYHTAKPASTMASRVGAELAKRTAFSSAINIMPSALATDHQHHQPQLQDAVRPYAAIPGPQELPLIGNSWRFAPIIGEYSKCPSLNEKRVCTRYKFARLCTEHVNLHTRRATNGTDTGGLQPVP